MTLTEAKNVLKTAGYTICEAYADVTPAQMAGMKSRLEQYLASGEEFKIKSKANPEGLAVTVKKEDDGAYVLYKGTTNQELTWSKDIDDFIKKIFDIQANLGAILNRDSFEDELPEKVTELLNQGQIVIMPDAYNNYDTLKQYTSIDNSVYLHGEAEDDAGFDICTILTKDGRPLKREQRYECVVPNEDKGFVPSYLYFWYDRKFVGRDFPYGIPRGLICYQSDTEGCNYAQEQLDAKSANL